MKRRYSSAVALVATLAVLSGRARGGLREDCDTYYQSDASSCTVTYGDPEDRGDLSLGG